MDINSINVIILAYLGDAVYEVYIRQKLIELGIVKVEELQRKATQYVSAKGQAKILNVLTLNNRLTEMELDIVRRGRNYKRSSHPRHTDIITYKHATGFEALIGYLFLSKQDERLSQLLNEIEVK